MMGDGPHLGCPYCGSALADHIVCPRCGTICQRCGTPYKGRNCPECGASSVSSQSTSSPEAPENTPFGEVAPEFHEARGIFDLSDRKWISRREWNKMRGTIATADGKRVHDRAIEAGAPRGRSGQAEATRRERYGQVGQSQQ